MYSIEVSSVLKNPKKKIVVISTKNSLKINTPKKNLVLVDVTGAYTEKSMFSFEGTLDIHKLMKRPASFKGREDADALYSFISVSSVLRKCPSQLLNSMVIKMVNRS